MQNNNKTNKPRRKDKGKRKRAGRGVVVQTKKMIQTNVPLSSSYSMRQGFSVTRGRYKDSIRIRGTELLDVVSIPATAPLGTAVSNVYINPQLFQGSRLQLYAVMYEKYLFNRLSFMCTTNCASTVGGSLIMAYDRDILDQTPPASLSGLKQYLSWEGTAQSPVWEPFSITCNLQCPDTGYYCNPSGDSDRLSYQGQFYLVVAQPPGLLVYGNMHFNYDVEFFIPQLESLTSQFGGGPTSVVSPDPTNSWANLGPPAAPVKQVSVLPNGKTGIKVDPGIYELIQTATVSVANNLQLPSFQQLSQLGGVLQSSLGVISDAGMSYRRSKLNVTDPAGAYIWGQASNANSLNSLSIILNKLNGVDYSTYQ